MSILDKFKQRQAPEPATPKPQPAQFSLEQRAQLLISELVKDLDAPNQHIINDLIMLISALAKNPDPSIDMNAVVQTAKVLIHQLVKPIPNPNQQIIDELLRLITVSSGTSEPEPKVPAVPVPEPTQPKVEPKPAAPAIPPQTEEPKQETPSVPATPAPPVPETQTPAAPAAPQVAEEPKQEQPAPKEEPKQEQPAPKEETKQEEPAKPAPAPAVATPAPRPQGGSKSELSKHMLNLIMDQTKEVVKVTNVLNSKVQEMEEKTGNKMGHFEDSINEMKMRIESYDKSFEDIQKAMDKFIGLYEIITNEFNPFITHSKHSSGGIPSSLPPLPTGNAPGSIQSLPQNQQPHPAAPPGGNHAPTPPAPHAPPQPTPPAQPPPAEPAQAPTQPAAPSTPAKAPQAPVTSPIQENIDVTPPPAPGSEEHAVENLPEDMGEMVKFLKKANDAEYNTLINGDQNMLAAWARSTARNPELSTKFEMKPPKQEAVKILMKAVLRDKVARQKAA